MRRISEIIVHCSDSPHGRGDDVETIRRWHIEERGWNDIGYHYVITETGEVQEGRPLAQVGAHCEGHNADSVGICLIGNDCFTQAQFAALRGLVAKLKERFEINRVVGHSYYNKKKTCPNFNVELALQEPKGKKL